MPAWEIALLVVLWLLVIWAIVHGLRKDAKQAKPETEDEDLP